MRLVLASENRLCGMNGNTYVGKACKIGVSFTKLEWQPQSNILASSVLTPASTCLQLVSGDGNDSSVLRRFSRRAAELENGLPTTFPVLGAFKAAEPRAKAESGLETKSTVQIDNIRDDAHCKLLSFRPIWEVHTSVYSVLLQLV